MDLRRPGPRHRRRLGAGSVAEHRHQPGRRKPVDRRRLGGRPDEARPVGDVPGVLRPRRRRPDLRRQAARAGMANCDGVKPAGVPVEGHVPAIGGFCWQQTGIPRSGADPSLNVDTSREGVEPDIAFTGINDGVPWIVWYEKGPSSQRAARERDGLRGQGRQRRRSRERRLPLGRRGPGLQRHPRHERHQPSRTVRGIRAGRGALLAEQEHQRQRREPARGERHDEPREPDLALDHLGRGGQRRQAGVRLAPRRQRRGSALRTRQRRRPDLDRDGRRHAARHHVLGPHAVRHLASGGRKGPRRPSRVTSPTRPPSCWTRATSR